ncbi:MAG: signal peptidase II [Gemmatimonadota bacterium]|nr:signal peptidase II [Gemmatimonadota bacterium]
MQSGNAGLFWPVVAVIAFIDVITKAVAVRLLVPQRVPHEVIGEAVRFTLVYNPGAAFGLHVGPYSRWVFMTLTVVALAILAWLYQSTRQGHFSRVLALALVCGGAIGNLIDRVRSEVGVVDFIDVGFGDSRWPTFNVADMAVSMGAFLLAWVLWEDDQIAHPQAAHPAVAPTTASAAPSAMRREPEPGEAS